MSKTLMGLPATIGEEVETDDLTDQNTDQDGTDDLIGGEGDEGTGDEGTGDEGTGDEGEEGAGDEGEEESELSRFMAQAQTQFSAYQNTINKLIQTHAPQGGAAKPDVPAIDFSDLPDPVVDPDKFKKELATRISGAIVNDRNSQTEQNKAAAQNKAIQDLWAGFQTEYADLAPKEALANSAASIELQALNAQGLDSLQWAIDNPVEFRKKVANRMKQELGMSGENRTANSGKTNKAGRRTAGVGGGSSGGAGKQSGGKKEPAGFLSQLKKAQMDSGLI